MSHILCYCFYDFFDIYFTIIQIQYKMVKFIYQQMNVLQLNFIIIFSFPLIVLNQFYLTDPPNWAPSNMFQAGKNNVFNGQADNTTVPPPSYTFIFANQFSDIPKLAYGISQYRGQDTFFSEGFFINRMSLTSTNFHVQVRIMPYTTVLRFSVAYIGVEPSFPYNLNSFDNIPINYTSGPLQNISQFGDPSVRQFRQYINYTYLCEQQIGNITYNTFGTNYLENKIILFTSTLDVAGLDYNRVKFQFFEQVINETYFTLTAIAQSYDFIGLLHFSMIIFNQKEVEASNQYKLVYQKLKHGGGGGTYIFPEVFKTNFIMGLLSFEAANRYCGIHYTWQFYDLGLTTFYVKVQPSVVYPTAIAWCPLDSMTSTVFYLKKFYCDPPFYYFNYTSQLCQTNCSQYNTQNTTDYRCIPCKNNCYDCYMDNLQQCLACNELGDNRILLNDKCVCQFGYYDNFDNSSQCVPCINIISNCTSCNSDVNLSIILCQTCQNGLYVVNNTCVCENSENRQMVNNSCQCLMGYYQNLTGDPYCPLCEISIVGCNECYSDLNLLKVICTNCTEPFNLLSDYCVCDDVYDHRILNGTQCICLNGYYENFTSLEYCLSCNQSIPFCVSCYPDINETIVICTQCQARYKTQNNACVKICTDIDKNLNIKFNSLIKSPSENLVVMSFALIGMKDDLFQYSLNDLNWEIDINLTQISFNISFIQYSQQLKELVINIRYFQDIHNQIAKVNFIVKIPNDLCFIHYYATQDIKIVPKNNIAAIFYTDQQYQQVAKVQSYLNAIQGVSGFMMLTSLLSIKIVGIQLTGVLQMGYLALGDYNNIPLILTPFMQLKSLNGLNLKIVQNKNNVPDRISVIGYDSIFLNNCNIMILVMIIVAVVGIGLLLLSNQVKMRKLNKVSKYILKQVLLTLVLYNSLNISFSAGLHFRYAKISDSFYIQSSVIAVVSLLFMLIIAFCLVLANSQQFGEYKDKLKNQFIVQNYFVVTILYRFGVGFYMASGNESQISTLLIMALSILFLLYNLVNLPFIQFYHNYRAVICHMSQFIILFVTMYYRSMKANQDVSIAQRIKTPIYFQFVVIGICVVLSVIVLGYEIFIWINSLCQKHLRIIHDSSMLNNTDTLGNQNQFKKKNQIQNSNAKLQINFQEQQ